MLGSPNMDPDTPIVMSSYLGQLTKYLHCHHQQASARYDDQTAEVITTAAEPNLDKQHAEKSTQTAAPTGQAEKSQQADESIWDID